MHVCLLGVHVTSIYTCVQHQSTRAYTYVYAQCLPNSASTVVYTLVHCSYVHVMYVVRELQCIT